MLSSSAKFTICSYPYNYLIIEDCFETNAAYGLSSVFNDLIRRIASMKALPNKSGCLNRNVTEIYCLQKSRSNFLDFYGTLESG